MSTHVIDSELYGDLFGTDEMRAVFGEESYLRKLLDVEAALAKAEALQGIIPPHAAEEIVRKAASARFDHRELREQISATTHPLVPLIRALQRLCDGDAGEFVHWGATTQDIMDTATVLQLKEAYQLILRDATEIESALAELAQRYRSTRMAGRTHGQHALPITFGYKVAVWLAEVHRGIQRLRACRARLLVGQFSGAVGTLASLDEGALKVQEILMEKLGLGVPTISWHTSRDAYAEFVSVLSILCSTLAKVSNEVIALQRTEIAELEEPFTLGKVGSSTMPHKRNPMICEAIVALARIVRSHLALAHEGMVVEHERDMRQWMAEWEYLPEICTLTSAILKGSLYVVRNLRVNVEEMSGNLLRTGGLIQSEAVMMALAKKTGRQTAHEIVYRLAMRAYEEKIPFSECLLESEEITRHLGKDVIESLLDPEGHTGLAEAFVDRVIDAIRSDDSSTAPA